MACAYRKRGPSVQDKFNARNDAKKPRFEMLQLWQIKPPC